MVLDLPSAMDLSLYSTVSTYYPNLGMLLDDAQVCLFNTTHAPFDLSTRAANRFPQLAVAFKKARESKPMHKKRVFEATMSKNQRATLKSALHSDVKAYFEQAKIQAFVTPKSFGTEPLPGDALQCVSAVGKLIEDAKSDIRKLEERINVLERAEIGAKRIAANARIINAFNASIAEDVDFNSIDTLH